MHIILSSCLSQYFLSSCRVPPAVHIQESRVEVSKNHERLSDLMRDLRDLNTAFCGASFRVHKFLSRVVSLQVCASIAAYNSRSDISECEWHCGHDKAE
ncbi:uncharacterized protein PHALS_14769 [Plasmopara halstedii]|uniref:Uncharacterized protein n=1 Tax=Plasmopara halstedii TaxID=4781 RepID=A0A0P1AS68_PLAHL|nr:uncharacterized protein PHALS_14769 [Plasmopara halstedii]CEG44026.1 hypothetical protein PHALS_14769 [Plasmopara halstedii]|eukprot:XP_024580395.1 hypothetical protein PHALS_14769 [Plasmopara halstedii]